MPETVFDASALIALLRSEPGADKVQVMLAGSCISGVNLTETLAKMVDYNHSLEGTAHQISRLQIPVIPFDEETAKIAASLRLATRDFDFSLADRACLALALQLGLPALTADKDWDKCPVGVRVVQIR